MLRADRWPTGERHEDIDLVWNVRRHGHRARDGLVSQARRLQIDSSCSAEIENEGHRFGEDPIDVDQNALIVFLATL